VKTIPYTHRLGRWFDPTVGLALKVRKNALSLPQVIETRFFGRPAHSRITMPDGQVDGTMNILNLKKFDSSTSTNFVLLS
jgi:hypothetical protein